MSKREVKPFIETGIKDTIYKISYATGHSVKGICEDLCDYTFSEGLGSELSPYFKRNLTIDGTFYQGNEASEKFESLSKDNERISMVINKNSYDYAYEFSYAIGCSVAKIVAYGIEKAMTDFDFLDQYITQLLSKTIGKDRKNELLKVVKAVNKLHLEEEYTIASLLLYIADEYRRFDEGVDGVLKDAYL